MDKSRFEELSNMDESPTFYFVATNLSELDEDGEPRFSVVDGLLGEGFDFGSILQVVESSVYYADEDEEGEVWADMEDYGTMVPLKWVFEDKDEAERVRANALHQFYSNGMRHCHVNEQIV